MIAATDTQALASPPPATDPSQARGAARPPHHVVQFYDHHAFPAESVAAFMGRGLAAGERAIVIATAAHRQEIQRALDGNAIDVDRCRVSGRLQLLDAEETLASFMVEGVPSWGKFDATVGSIVRAWAGDPDCKGIRAFGEMVDLLWGASNREAALRLEAMWNALELAIPFTLLCGYHLAGFRREDDTAGFVEVCRAHHEVLPAESYVALADDAQRSLQVALLQQRARALETEIERRKAVEQSLRAALAERDLAERARQASELELRDFVENAAEGMHWVDGNGIIVWANAAELELLGYTRDEYVGHSITEFHADPHAIADILERLGRDETVKDYEATLRGKDGAIRHVLIHSNVYWKDGRFCHTRCFTRDITARRLAEQRLRDAENERALALERERAARAEAEAANRAKDEFLAMLGHELRNPLAPIVTALQVGRMAGRGTPELDIIERHVDHVTRLVDDLLDISRITRGQVAIHRERLDVADVVARAVEMSAPAIERKQQALTVDLPARSCQVFGDLARLAQVISNLLVNASKYSDPGTRIWLTGAIEDDRVILRVRDQGVGIAPDMLGPIFEPFVQHEQARDRARGGLGLGLAIVRSLVELHGGSVIARSEGPGLGSELEVRLPLTAASDPVAVAPAPRLPAPTPHVAQRILVVDDNEDAADILAAALRVMGHETCVAHDGPGALRAAAEFRPTLALLDIGLPVMDGYELATRLAAEPWSAGLRLIALTGYGQPDDRQRSLAAGFTEHLVKPVKLATIRELLARSADQPDRSATKP